MTRSTQQWHKWVRLPLAAAVAASISAPVSAFQFYLGEVEGAFDTTLSAGASWRVSERDQRLIAQGNLGQGNLQGQPIGSSTNNYDDGNLNFDKGDIYSKIVKGTSELYLNYNLDNEYLNRVGGFVRGKYWYDFKLKDEEMARDPAGQRRQLNAEADKNASGGELMDAYVWTDWTLGGTPLSLRYGKQVVSWGESTFIQGGINSINPVDVGAIRAPGAEIKEALIPVEMFYLSAGVSDTVTVEGFVQMDWQKTRPDDCGTFFSTNDFAPDGCGPVLLAGHLPDSVANAQGIFAPRVGDKQPDDNDQFGMAIRWYVPELNESELGFYYMRYHSRLPLISGVVNNPAAPNAALGQMRDPTLPTAAFPSYFVEYPEGINLYGASISTNTPGGWSLGAEYSFRENMPLQWNAFELIYGGLQLPNSLLFQRERAAAAASGENLAGKEMAGYDRFHVSQAQFTLIKFIDQVMGASRMSVVTEFGGTYVHGLPSKDEARYGRSGTFGIGDFNLPALGISCSTNPAVSPLPTNNNPLNCTNEGFTTSFSWGYRARFTLDYNNAFAGVNLFPTLAWSHDVQGNAPEPGANFMEGRKSIGLSLRATYLNQYQAEVGYTNFFGGGRYNELTDRDNVGASISYAF